MRAPRWVWLGLLACAACAQRGQEAPPAMATPVVPASGGATAVAGEPMQPTAAGAAAGSGGVGTAAGEPARPMVEPMRPVQPVQPSAAGSSGSSPGQGQAGAAGAPQSPRGSCTLPSGADPAAARALYAKWKADLLTADGAGGFVRVRRPNSGTQINSSNSEGIAYGMLIAVYMDDQPTFDGLWQYEQLHRGKNGLMEWEIAPDGKVIGSGAASDGDEDMAFALIVADQRWGGRGSLPDSYRNYALTQLDLMWKHEVDHERNHTFMPGDDFDGARVINISYFAPAYYRIFAEYSGKPEWLEVVKSSYAVLEATLNAANKNATNGLVPAWSTPEGVPMAPPGSGHPIHHQLDSCRTPFRIAQDYCWFGEPRAKSYLEKIGSFHAQVGVTKLVDGYNLDGTPFAGANLHLAAFVVGAAVGALAIPELAAVRDQAYDEVMRWSPLIGGSEYYNKSWSMIGALMLTGEFKRGF